MGWVVPPNGQPTLYSSAAVDWRPFDVMEGGHRGLDWATLTCLACLAC